jgi:hypothetical protein
MLVVGELINSSRKAVKEAIQAENIAEIQKIAKDQQDNGADYIDINAGTFVGKKGQFPPGGTGYCPCNCRRTLISPWLA